MRRCSRCGAIVQEDATRCGVCGEDFSAIEHEPLHGRKKPRFVKRFGRMVLVFYGIVGGLIALGIGLASLPSEKLNVAGIVVIACALMFFLWGAGRGSGLPIGDAETVGTRI